MAEVITIIVTYNGEKWINQCLESLSRSRVPTKIIIIDNASIDHTTAIIRKHSGNIRLIENDANLGFGQANNIGMKYAMDQSADFILLLNQDAYLYPDTIGELVAIAGKHPEYGIISPLQLNGSGQQLDQLFRKFISNNYPEKFVRDIEAGRPPGGLEIFPVRFVNAAAWFIPLKCLQTTGLFHPLFYHYGEDNHYCSRVQYHGFKAGITPKAAVRHDRTYEDSGDKSLQRHIHLDTLYILLDIRRSIFMAYLIVFWKFVGYLEKSIRRGSPATLRLALSRLIWVLFNSGLIRKTRKSSKQCYLPAQPKT